jgi:hypothetical protein
MWPAGSPSTTASRTVAYALAKEVSMYVRWSAHGANRPLVRASSVVEGTTASQLAKSLLHERFSASSESYRVCSHLRKLASVWGPKQKSTGSAYEPSEPSSPTK